ncbi:MAG: DEAD/DEAH box helicase [Minisyncoccia bacterium]
MDSKDTPSGFLGLGIAPAIFEAIERLHFRVPTPIQLKSIPVAIQGSDLIGIAQTGTGKTLAFGVPMIQHLMQGGGQGLVVLPTRELALQVEEMLGKLGNALGLKMAVVIGGAPMFSQRKALERNPHIIIATPGRIIDHIENSHLKLNKVRILVLDEADRMMDMGFAPQLKKILQAVPKERQTMLFSATMPDEIAKIAANFMKLPTRLEIAPSGTTPKEVAQEVFFVQPALKNRLLERILYDYHGPILIFTRTKYGARKVNKFIRDLGHKSSEIHSDRSQFQRKQALDGFKSGQYRILVATDIAARGIDVQGIEVVINYDLPNQSEDYVHRIGRTGRAGQVGRAISFALPNQWQEIRDIERLMKLVLPVSKLPEGLPSQISQEEFFRSERPPQNRQFKRRSTPRTFTRFHTKRRRF